MGKNLLPNASFELGLGEQIPTNWGDLQNALTLKLTATGQQPEAPPRTERQDGAPDGEYVARIELEPAGPGAIGHLTSAAVLVKPGQAYTLSAYARSDLPSVVLQLAFWTRPVDWEQPADALSDPMPLSSAWQRLHFTFVAEDLVDLAVIDLVATSDAPGGVWVDAVQLEEGPEATRFETRYPVEGSLAGRRRPTMLHLANEPFELYLSTFNQGQTDYTGGLRVSIETLLEGVEVFSRTSSDPVPSGACERKLTLDFPLVGEFRARLWSADGAEIGVGDYIFVVHPVMDRDFQGILCTRDGRAGRLPAERVWLPWENKKDWYADSPQNLTVTQDDLIHVPLADGQLARTRDGGRTWEVYDPGRAVMSVLRDGTFLAVEYGDGQIAVHRSCDQGATWEAAGTIPCSEGPQCGPITELADGDLIWPIGRAGKGVIVGGVYAHRSTDRGGSWSEGWPICPGGEPQIVELQSGPLLAVVRNNPRVPADDWGRCLKNEMAWRCWQRLRRGRDLSSYVKRLLLADSCDRGVTWTNVRPGTFLLDEMHGGAVELPDSRIVLLYTHRWPALRGGERAKVSRDGGQTWQDELYHLNTTPAYPGYSASCVLPRHLADGQPGMILTVVGERSEANWGHVGAPPTSEGIRFAPRMQAIRWRPVD